MHGNSQGKFQSQARGDEPGREAQVEDRRPPVRPAKAKLKGPDKRGEVETERLPTEGGGCGPTGGFGSSAPAILLPPSGAPFTLDRILAKPSEFE
ncbi:Hypothetical protein NTJ_00815 [Nesidiocoris tenuis]|uniref:Uncharacterized protein n=1 Tax=Nesidiocoris tenuis TaxID=355587 RepID=A0ABN7A7P5_9HEMI|nr:Hypothetical protein NTJ_00815 [Nesidiocoris tenuis]